jgi:hypothetical protein
MLRTWLLTLKVKEGLDFVKDLKRSKMRKELCILLLSNYLTSQGEFLDKQQKSMEDQTPILTNRNHKKHSIKQRRL